MEKIKSFFTNHLTHEPGFYQSDEKKGIYTYDLRFKKPNGGDYLSYDSIHTIEHLFATVIRNGANNDDVIYFGPMGCRTGFYLLLSNVSFSEAKNLVLKTLNECLSLDKVPGQDITECGNYLEHDLKKAQKDIKSYLKCFT